MLNIKDIIEIVAIVMVGLGIIDAIRHDRTVRNSEAYTSGNETQMLEKAEFCLLVLVFIATAIAAYYTRQQWITADDQEKRSLRAYIIVNSAEFDRDESGKLKLGLTDANGSSELLIRYKISNEGATPAYDVEQYVAIEYPFKGTITQWYTQGVAGYVAKQQTLGPVRTQYFSKDQIEAFSSGKGTPLLFAGQLNYRDIFKRRWPTNFCFIYAAAPVEPTFIPCPSNSAGAVLTHAE